MYIRASSAHGWNNSHITGIHHQYSSDSTQLQSKNSLNTQPPDLEYQRLTEFWSQSYVIIAYLINFQVHSSPGQIQIKFALCILGICLQVNWDVELKKVS